MTRKHPPVPGHWRIVAAAALLGAGTAVAEDLYVQPQKLPVRKGPSQTYTAVDTVTQNTKLQVLERGDDGWIKVQTPSGQQGYVFRKTVGTQLASANSGGDSSGSNITSDSVAADLGASAAGKGVLEPEAQGYAKSKNYNPDPLNKLMALNEDPSVKDENYDKFCDEGKVGPHKPRGI